MSRVPVRGTEAALILACARLELDAGDRARITELIDSPIDWQRLLALGERHGLLPLLHRHFDRIDSPRVPIDVRASLWASHEARARRNRGVARELATIVTELEGRGIPVLPFKGPALAVMLYGDVALREFGDLDLLVSRRDALAAREALAALGYADRYVLTPALREAMLASPMHYHFVLEQRGRAMVELHWKSDPAYPVERAEDPRWWSTLAREPFEGIAVRAFSPADLLLALCVHGSKHYWASLGWLVDVAELLRHAPALPWPAIRGRARALGAERRLDLGLNLAQALLAAPIADEALAAMRANEPASRLAEAVMRTLFDVPYAALAPLAALRLDLALHDRLRQRVRSGFGAVFSPTLVEWSRWPLPRALFALYPPLRVARLTGKYAARALGRR